MSKTNTPKIDLMADEQYAEAVNPLNEIKLAILAKEQAMQDLESAIRVDQVSGETQLTEAASAIAKGEQTDLSAVEVVRNRLATLRKERRALVQALPTFERRAAKARSEASRRLCETLQPAYERIMRKLAAAAKELGEAQAEFDEFREALERADVEWLSSFRPLGVRWASGDRRGGERPVDKYLAEVREYVPTAVQ